MSDSVHTCARVTFAGRVQGVGFRFTAVRIASSYRVTGYVKNCSDGTVELLAEGEREEVEAFIGAVAERMGGTIHEQQVTWWPATGRHAGFDVVFR